MRKQETLRPNMQGTTGSIRAIGRTYGNPHREIRQIWSRLGSEGSAISSLLITRQAQKDKQNGK